jgi:hypothetical protein
MKPWWQTGQRPRFAFVMGGVYLAVGVGDLTLTALGGAPAWMGALSSIWLILAAFYLSAAVAARRHTHTASRGVSGEHRL